jgi:hypothetical protein
MKITILAVLLFLSYSLHAQSQYNLKGVVIDTTSNTKLVNTTISVLNSKDSTLYKFSRATTDGTFAINNLSKGKFILLVTYPGYADYVEHFTLDSARTSRDFGKVNMILKANLLASVLIKGDVKAIKIKGDTTEYNAAAFKIQPNAKVEDLLMQLPGIQVDKDGKITAQGQTVTKVLVDGEEFFGDDPTLVTKNLRGDMVDKVQLYDKKSDQATFTGIDDGIKNKTLNIKLKEDKKNGYFGKIDGGGAGDNFYQGQGMFNAFKAKRKMSAYATVANTGKTGLGWEDGNKYGESNNVEITDDGGMSISSRGDDLRYNGQGIPTAKTGGMHYDTKWNKDKESINTNYKAGELSIDGNRNNRLQNTLPTGVFNNVDNQAFRNSTFRQKLDATYQLKIDSTSNLKLAIEGTIKQTKSNSNYISASTRENNTKQNNSSRNLTNDGEQQLFSASAFYNKKLKKTGRTFSATISQNLSRNDDEGLLNSQNQFFNKQEVLDSTRLINQLKTNHAVNSVFNSNLTYTEPFSKAFSVILNYGLNLNNSTSDKRSFNETSPGNYNDLDAAFSNNFELNQTSNQGGLIFNYKKDKTIVNFGTKLAGVKFEQVDLNANKSYQRNFINLNPQASYQYKFSQQKSFRFDYSGNTTQPSISQIQPIRVNTDPLNISLGNPDLKPAFRSSINANFNSYKVLANQYISLRGTYGFVINPIVMNTVTDSAGKSTYQSFNFNDKMASNYNISGYFDRKIKALGFNLGVNFNVSSGTSFSYINNVLNSLQSENYSGGITASKYVPKKFDFYASFGPRFNNYKASLQTRINNNGRSYQTYGQFNIYLPKKFQISSDFQYNLNKKTQTFTEDVDYFILNSSFSKKFMKNESLKLGISGNDLLNQNIGFNRNASGNTISQNSYTTIKRYFLLSLVWDFNKMGGGLKTPAK